MTRKNIITCGECRHWRQIPDAPYGTCNRRSFMGVVMKDSDFCSYAEFPAPAYDDHSESGLLEGQ